MENDTVENLPADLVECQRLYRITYTVRGRRRGLRSTVDRLALARRAAERRAVPDIAAAWRVSPDAVTVTWVGELAA
jgi:hypothetical protein